MLNFFSAASSETSSLPDLHPLPDSVSNQLVISDEFAQKIIQHVTEECKVLGDGIGHTLDQVWGTEAFVRISEYSLEFRGRHVSAISLGTSSFPFRYEVYINAINTFSCIQMGSLGLPLVSWKSSLFIRKKVFTASCFDVSSYSDQDYHSLMTFC